MTDSIVEIKNVTHTYKGMEEASLENVSLSVRRGEVVLLCGASGSGKTSVIRLMNGLIPHYYKGEVSGDVIVDGRDIFKTELYDLAGIVGTVFQNPRSQFFSVETDGEIVFGPENIGLAPEVIKQRKEAVVEQMDLSSLLGRSLFALSGGEKQRIACTSVAALFPEIILLDEPSSNLDWAAMENLRTIMESWKKQGKTIVISEHRLWYLSGLVDRVIYMDRGRIADEWTGRDFYALEEERIRALKLRPTIVPQHFAEVFRGTYEKTREHREASEQDLVLKGFYHSYSRKPYVLRKKRFTGSDKDLTLCIPELRLPRGSVIAVVGKNGTGKSTFLRCICGLEKDCEGSICYEDEIYTGRKRIGLSYMVMQDVNHQLFTDSVEAEVMLSMKDKDAGRCHEILDSLGILECKDKHPMALSGGQKQRVAIASAMAAEAKVLLFDEPTSGLDYDHMNKVGDLLKQLAAEGKTILVSTHDPELIERCCDHELYIRDGKVDFFERLKRNIRKE